MSVFSDIQAAGLTVHRELAGEAITYRRGEDLEIEIEFAVPLGGARLEERDTGIVLQTDSLEWGINREDLVDDETEIIPKRGDTIEFEWKDRTLTFTVLPDGASQCWKWSDRGQSQYRIFTKLTATT